MGPPDSLYRRALGWRNEKTRLKAKGTRSGTADRVSLQGDGACMWQGEGRPSPEWVIVKTAVCELEAGQ